MGGAKKTLNPWSVLLFCTSCRHAAGRAAMVAEVCTALSSERARGSDAFCSELALHLCPNRIDFAILYWFLWV